MPDTARSVSSGDRRNGVPQGDAVPTRQTLLPSVHHSRETRTSLAQRPVHGQVAAWVLLGAQSLLQAARVAAAWLIAMGPIGLVIAAVVGLMACATGRVQQAA